MSPPVGRQARAAFGHTLMEMLPFLLLAATLEIGGDAAFRYGLVRPAWPWLLVGGTMLVAYWTAFGERPSATLIVGGTLIVAGGLVIQAGMP